MGAGIGMILFNVAHFAQCRDIWKCHSRYYRNFSDTVCIKESKTRTLNLIRLCEDANSTGYEHSKTKVCMLKMMALAHCSLKRVNRNNLLYYMRVPAMCLLAFYLCSQTCRST